MRRRGRNFIGSYVDLFIHFDLPKQQQDVEQFCAQYESEHGPTDLSRFYTCWLPVEKQDWLITHQPHRFFEGLPPFLQAYIEACMEQMAEQGHLDTMEMSLLDFFVRRKMNDGPGR